MLICQDCGSTNIIEKEIYQAYFREGNWIRLRSILVWGNENDNPPKGVLASCPELSKTVVALGNTNLEAIAELGKLLHDMYPGIELKGNKLE